MPTDQVMATARARPLRSAPLPKVALMGRSLRGSFSGVVRYTDELVRALAPELGDNLSVFVTRSSDGLHELPIQRIRAQFRTPNEYARAFWEQCVVPFEVGRLHPDVYHSPNYILPLSIRCPSVVTVHDVAFLDRTVHRLRSHLYLSVLTVAALRKAARVVCVSGYTATRLTERFPWVYPKTVVIGEGISSRFAPQSQAAISAFRARHNLAAPYVLFVGTVEPRKNLDRLIRSFGEAVVAHRLPHDLVIGGAAGWKTSRVRAAFERSPVRDRIRFIGYVDDAELPAAYAGADLFVYPSLHEGFGLPPLEAMACGTPVVTSNTTALGEVAGPAALTVRPDDDAALANAIAAVVADPQLADALTELGFGHAASFRWASIAHQMLDLYREVSS